MKDPIQNLRDLRKKAASINATLIEDLKPFFGSNGLVFRRLPDSDEEGNVTNTCSCLMALATSGDSVDFLKQALDLDSEFEARSGLTDIFQNAVSSEWTSSGLPDDNAFTSLIVLRTGGLLSKGLLTKPALDMSHAPRSMKGRKVRAATARTLRTIAGDYAAKAPDSFGVGVYPSTPGIAYWFVDAVENLRPNIGRSFWDKITSWSSETFARQVSLVRAHHDSMKDPVAMGLAACLATRLRRIISDRSFRARDRLVQKLPTNIEVEAAILNAFHFQEKSGIWPKYFPLFNYQKGAAGSNYLFSFEVLEVIVDEFENSTLLGREEVLRGFQRALDWCESNRLIYEHEGKTYKGWNSGGQITTLMQGKPEAWATAMVHMFLTKLRSALSTLIESNILNTYNAKSDIVPKDSGGWDNFIDSPVILPNRKTSIKKLIQSEILAKAEQRSRGFHRKKMNHRRSVLLFGPPGTSKTSLVRAIAKKIGWPLVELNPSHFLRRGLEHIYSESESIFNDLNDLSRTVVFFDEMDALAHRREDSIDVTRQLLTTSMLPKLSKLHNEGRVLFFMATNHQRLFDPAIKRPGRFDLLICMAPPSWKEKLNNLERFWTGNHDDDDVTFVRDRLRQWASAKRQLVKTLGLFTFDDFKSFLEHLSKPTTLREAVEKMSEEEFNDQVKEWGDTYITLNAQEEKPKTDISLKQEFKEDSQASRIQ